MSKSMQKPSKRQMIVNREHYFGACPYCGDTDGFINIENDHWFLCVKHKTAWYAGAGLFSCWKEENEKIWNKNRRLLRKHRIVEPLQMECDFGECGEEQDEDDEEQDEDNHGWL